MTFALQSLSDCLAGLLARLPPAAQLRKRPWHAVGAVSAQTIMSPYAVPEKNTALQTGYAVASADTVGASPQSPVFLPGQLESVAIDGVISGHCDAVLDEKAIGASGVVIDNSIAIAAQAAPGQHVRFAGHDLAKDFVIVRSGEIITPGMALACTLVDIHAIDIVAPVLFIPPHENPARDWLAAQLQAQGCIMAGKDEAADIHIRWNDRLTQQLALSPGAAIAVHAGAQGIVLDCPPRFDSVSSLYMALLLPSIAAMTERQRHIQSAPLRRKITSAIGLADIVLLRREGDGLMPLSTGDITLEALLQADGFSILPPSSEGLAAGENLDYTPMSEPLTRRAA